MMIELPADMNNLLDKILLDLPDKNINLYEILDTPEFTSHFEDFDLGEDETQYVLFKDFVASVIAYFDINYGKTIYKHIFAAIVMDIFGDMQYWELLEPEEFEEKKEQLFQALQDVNYQLLPQGHLDFEMVYTMLEEQLEL